MANVKYLWHPTTDTVFSGYGLDIGDCLVGLLCVDRPEPVDERWLQSVTDVFGSYDLYPMTKTLDRGIACCMFVHQDSRQYLRDDWHVEGLERFCDLLTANEPHPRFNVSWDWTFGLWVSEFRTVDVDVRQAG